jgi:hypothetical protein
MRVVSGDRRVVRQDEIQRAFGDARYRPGRKRRDIAQRSSVIAPALSAAWKVLLNISRRENREFSFTATPDKNTTARKLITPAPLWFNSRH